MKPVSECLLYTFVDTGYLRGRDPAEIADQLCQGGSDIIQLRAKDLDRKAITQMAQLIRPITRRANVRFVINDHLGVAQETGADFCHFGQEDFFDAGYRHVAQLPKASGPRPPIGLSSHAPEQARRAVTAGADYIAIGPIYATGTKPSAKPVTLEYVRWAAEHVWIPWFAIGGITLENVDEILAAGARRICVMSAILNAPDIAEACRQFRTKFLASTWRS